MWNPMSVVVKQVSQDLPCIGATALTEVRPVNVGSLLQYDDSLYGVVRAIKPVRNACLYTLNTGVLFSEYIAEYQSEVELDIEFQPKRKSSAKLLADLDKQRCIVLSDEQVQVHSRNVNAVGILYDAGLYKKMTKTVDASPWVFWSHYELDDDNDLCCLGKNDEAIYCYSGLRSKLHQMASLEVRILLSRCSHERRSAH